MKKKYQQPLVRVQSVEGVWFNDFSAPPSAATH